MPPFFGWHIYFIIMCLFTNSMIFTIIKMTYKKGQEVKMRTMIINTIGRDKIINAIGPHNARRVDNTIRCIKKYWMWVIFPAILGWILAGIF